MKIEIDYYLLQDLVSAAENVKLFYNALVNGETRDVHPDWDSVEYLLSESETAVVRGRAALHDIDVANHAPDDDLPF